MWALLAALWLSAPAAAQTLSLTPPAAPAEEEKAERAEVPLVSPDPQIARRLGELFGLIEGLENVSAQVQGGVVTLRGETLTPAKREEAEAIASKLAGVVSVENEITAERNVGRRLQPLIQQARELWRDALSFLPLLGVALLVFAAFWAMGHLLTRTTHVFRKVAPNAFIEGLLERAVRLGFILLGLVAAMSVLGVTALLGSVLGAAGLVGLAVGFAVRDTIENYIASILLSLRQPFAPNDHVVIEGYEGRITLLNSRATVLTTLDGNEVRIPNATVYKANITNFSRIPERRFEFEVGIGYENDAAAALATALGAARKVKGVLDEPRPVAVLDRLDPSVVTMKVLAWVDQSTSDYAKVKSETIRQVKEALEAACVSMPEPIQNIRLLQDEAQDRQPAAATPPTPSGAHLDEVADTGADDTIRSRVEAIRTRSDDLLSKDAPRE